MAKAAMVPMAEMAAKAGRAEMGTGVSSAGKVEPGGMADEEATAVAAAVAETGAASSCCAASITRRTTTLLMQLVVKVEILERVVMAAVQARQDFREKRFMANTSYRAANVRFRG